MRMRSKSLHNGRTEYLWLICYHSTCAVSVGASESPWHVVAACCRLNCMRRQTLGLTVRKWTYVNLDVCACSVRGVVCAVCEIVFPWVILCWESFRSVCFDSLRLNSVSDDLLRECVIFKSLHNLCTLLLLARDTCGSGFMSPRTKLCWANTPENVILTLVLLFLTLFDLSWTSCKDNTSKDPFSQCELFKEFAYRSKLSKWLQRHNWIDDTKYRAKPQVVLRLPCLPRRSWGVGMLSGSAWHFDSEIARTQWTKDSNSVDANKWAPVLYRKNKVMNNVISDCNGYFDTEFDLACATRRKLTLVTPSPKRAASSSTLTTVFSWCFLEAPDNLTKSSPWMAWRAWKAWSKSKPQMAQCAIVLASGRLLRVAFSFESLSAHILPFFLWKRESQWQAQDTKT